MQISNSKYKNIFLQKGFFIKRNFFDKKIIKKILSEIKIAKGVTKYYDKKNNIRRVEKLYNKGYFLKYLNHTKYPYLRERVIQTLQNVALQSFYNHHHLLQFL